MPNSLVNAKQFQKMISYTASPKHAFLLRTGAVCICEEKVLLVRTAKKKIWFLPGGRNEFFENLEETLKREIFEELQCEIEIERLLWIHERFTTLQEKLTHQIAFYFLSKITSPLDPKTGMPIIPTSIIDGDTELEAAWVPLAELPHIEDDKINSFLKTALLSIPSHPVYIFEPFESTKAPLRGAL